MKSGMIILSVLALNFSFLGTGLAETADIKIDQSEKRMKAIIPAENSVAPGREPNLIDRGAGAVGHGLYAVAKTGVQGVGNGLDAVVDCVRRAGRSVYGWIASLFQDDHEE